jgi:hypothetical protein
MKKQGGISYGTTVGLENQYIRVQLTKAILDLSAAVQGPAEHCLT